MTTDRHVQRHQHWASEAEPELRRVAVLQRKAIAALEEQHAAAIASLEAENAALKKRVARLERQLRKATDELAALPPLPPAVPFKRAQQG